MSDLLKQKNEIFVRVWELYKSIEDTLTKAGITRFPDYGKVFETLEDTHVNKLRHGEEWMKHFILKHITPWRKLRAENSEAYWENAKLMGLGKDFKEIRMIGEFSKAIRKEWFTQHNILVVKKEKKADE